MVLSRVRGTIRRGQEPDRSRCRDVALPRASACKLFVCVSTQFQSLQHIEDIEWEKFWNPKLYVENSLGEPQETIWQTLTFNSRGEATVYERRRIKGCFLENLELDEFPFDTQVDYRPDLTLIFFTE